MRKKILLLLFIFISTAAFAISQDFVPGQVIVKFKAPEIQTTAKGARVFDAKTVTFRTKSVRALNEKNRLSRVKQIYRVFDQEPDQYVLTFPKDADLKRIIKEYQKDPNVEYAELNTIVRAFAPVTPNDPSYVDGTQYYLNNIQCPNSWGVTTGTNETLMAVLDTGINYNHVDLQGQYNLSLGYDFINNDDDPWDDHTGAHGTTVSGVIAAATNNAIGVAGINWHGTVVPIKVLNSAGEGSIDQIVSGINWAVTKNVDIINMSFGQYSASTALKNACDTAFAAGIVLVAAAGNGNVSDPSYPAYYDSVVAVAAVDENDERSVWGGIDPVTHKTQASNYGTWVDISAPGTSIYTTYKNNSYVSTNGTSLACPVVVGAAGLIKSLEPSLTNQQIINKLTAEADNIDALNPGFAGLLGSGRLNVYDSILSIGAIISSPVSGAYVSGSTAISGTATGRDFASYKLEALKNSVFVATIESSTTSVESGLLGTWDTTAYNGDHTIKLTVFSASGVSEEASILLHVDNTTPEAVIGNIVSGETYTGRIIITGEAIHSNYFDYYVLQYGKGTSPATFETIGIVYASVEAGVLGSWETVGLSGEYTLKLIAVDKAGKSVETSVTIVLQNSAEPTKEAEPQTPLPLTYALPNPFDRASYSEVTFNYTLDGNFLTKIYIFDLNGSLVWQNAYAAGVNGGKAGANNPAWDGKNVFGAQVANGVYLYQIFADNRILARGKLIILNN